LLMTDVMDKAYKAGLLTFTVLVIAFALRLI